MSAPEVLRFDRFVLDCNRRELLSSGAPVEMGARAFDLLKTLAQNPGRILTKTELFAAAWPGVTVDENNLQVQVSALRKIVGAKAITTVPGRGYQFTIGVTGAPAEAPTTPIAPPARLIGRAQDLVRIAALITDYSLVTILGPGGVGKTVLARALAETLAGPFEGRVTLAELAPVRDPALVPAAIAAALGLKLQPGAETSQIAARLAESPHLLILDNCEHQVAAVVSAIEDIVRGAPGARILVTSQARLGLSSENVVALEPLAAPLDVTLYGVEQSPAAVLFAARAAQSMPGFELTAANAEAVSDICHRLDGIPLALELAAARVGLLGVDGVRMRLGQRLKLLTKGQRGAAQRHATLRAALQWSYELLPTVEQFVFRCLSVFRGGFTGSDVQSVAVNDEIDEWTSLDALSTLIDRSLVARRTGGDPSAEPRFTLLESMAEFATSMSAEAGELEAARARHAAHFTAMAIAVGGRRGHEARNNRNFEPLDLQNDNLRAAYAWVSAHDRVQAFLLADTLAIYWRLRGHLTEARDCFNALIDGDNQGVEDLARAQLLTASCGVYFELRDVERLTRNASEAVRLWTALRDDVEIGLATSWVGHAAWIQGDLQRAKTSYEEALLNFRRGNHPGRIAETINNIATALVDLDRPAEACKMLPESLTLSQSAGDNWGLAFGHEVMGFARFALGELEESVTAWCNARDGYDKAGHAQRSTLVRLCLTAAALRQRDLVSARACLGEALDRVAGRPFNQEIADAILLGAQVCEASGQAEDSAALFAAARHWVQTWNVTPEPPIKFGAAAAEERVRGHLTGAAFDAATQAGLALSPQAALSNIKERFRSTC